MPYQVSPAASILGEIEPPGDKSISHRAVMLGSLAHGVTSISNFLHGADTAATIACLQALGIDIRVEDPAPSARGINITIEGHGREGFREPEQVLDVRNSGTTMRVMSGILASLPFLSVMTGDDSIVHRPMRRVIDPLRHMGADIFARADESYPPIVIKGAKLRGIEYSPAVMSAQVKTAVLLAGLGAEGRTIVNQASASRDHTTRMLATMGARISAKGANVELEPSELNAIDIQVPGDISSAAPWLVLAAAHPHARIRLSRVGVNPSRIGIVHVLRSMGATITLEDLPPAGAEPLADISVESGHLIGVTIEGDVIPNVIDEIPIIALAATQADGETIIRDAAELRVKESDRISATTSELRKLGADIEELPDGMIIRGPTNLKGSLCRSHGDHRLAMTLGIAGLLAQEETIIYGPECVDVSYPGFWEDLESLRSS